MSKTAIVISEDRNLIFQIDKFFAKSQIKFKFIPDAYYGIEIAQKGGVELIIIDYTLTGLDGLALCEKLRSRDVQQPIIMLVPAQPPSLIVSALNSGADYYLVKPLSMHLLRSRVLSCLRRTPRETFDTLQLYDLTINKTNRMVLRDNKQIYMGNKEFSILLMLVENAGRVVKKERMNYLTSRGLRLPKSSCIDVHISRLRKKLKNNGYPSLIRTIYGQGYILKTDDL